MISGTRWGCSVSATMALYNSLFVGLLRYTLPVMNGASKTVIKDLESAQAQALRSCLGLPKCTSKNGTLAEAKALPLSALRTQETIRTHLRHVTRNTNDPLKDIVESKPSSSFSKIITLLKDNLPNLFEAAQNPTLPPWMYPPLEIIANIPGIGKKAETSIAVITQIALEYIYISNLFTICALRTGVPL